MAHSKCPTMMCLKVLRATKVLPFYVILLIILTSSIPTTWGGFACMENPCMHGICIDYLQTNSTHQCFCRDGFTGYECEINWDECKSQSQQPCLNGGTCVDLIANYNCSCPENFSGAHCEIDLSRCEETFPCHNNGSCIVDTNNVTGTGFICQCQPGFSGNQCEIDISVCNETENVCQNGGKCLDGIGEKFYCECVPGWSGDTCTIEIDECLSQPCENGGICVNKINDFSCACPFGFTGRACETKLKICKENPCLNGAFCLNEQDDESSFQCFCVPDYHGVYCEGKYDDCAPSPKCLNGGTCVDGVGDFSCDCLPDFFGKICECTAENATEPECIIYANGTMKPPPDVSQSPILSSDFFPPVTTQLLPDSASNGMSQFIEMSSLKSEIITTGIFPIPLSSPYDPGGGEGRGDVETSGMLLSPDVSRHDSMSEFPAPAQTADISRSQFSPFTTNYDTVSISPGESLFSPVPEVSTTIRLDGSEDTISLVLSTSGITSSSFLTPALTDSLITPYFESPTPILLSPFYDVSDEVLGSSPSVTHDIISTDPIQLPPGFHTVDLTAAFPSISLVPEADIVDSTVQQPSPPAITSSTAQPSQQIEEPFTMQQGSELMLTPTLPIDMTPATHIMSDYILPSITTPDQPEVSSQTVFLDSSTAILDISGYVPSPTTAIMYSSSIADDEITASSLFISATPTAEVPLSSAIPTSQPNFTDSCENYCHNNAKCIADTIEPICLCSFKFTGNQCEIPKEKFKAASFTGDSFLSFRVPNESVISKVDISSKFVTIVPEGILLYAGVGRMYALIFTQNGHVTLHFSCGSQSMHFVETRTRIDNGFNFTLDFRMEMIVQGVSQLRCSAEVSVNQSYVMKGEQVVGRDGAIRGAADHPIEKVYLGGIPPFHTDASLNDDIVRILPGFRGCLHTLMVNQEPKDIYDDALDGKEVAECSSFGCVANPCHGSATCVSTHAYPFWECVCPHGYDGRRCQIIVCNNNPCKNGATCTYSQEALNLLSNSAEEELIENRVAPAVYESTTVAAVKDVLNPICLCPFGFSGSVCQHKINITKPAFKPVSGYSSFIAYEPIPRFIDWFQLKFHFVTKNISQISLLLYSGNNRGPQPLFLHTNNHLHDHESNLLLSLSTASPSSNENNNNNNEFMQISGFDQTVADAHPEPVSDFFAVTFLQGFIALTWNLGSGTQRITTPSRIDNRLNIHTLFAGRSGRQAWLKVDGMRNVTGRTPGPLYRLNSDSNELYIGGYKTYRFEGLSHDLPLHQGFQGCIFDLGFRVRNRLYLPKAMDGRNVKNCFEEDC